MNTRVSVLASAFILSFFLGGCVQNPSRQYPSQNLGGRLIGINGTMVKMGGEFSLGRFTGLPRVRSTGDISALQALLGYYQSEATLQIKRGDYDAALMANHLAAKVADYLESVSGSTRDGIRSLREYGDGRMDVAAGAYMVLPSFDRYDSEPKSFSFNDWPYGKVHELAMGDLETKLDVVMGVLDLVTGKESDHPQDASPLGAANTIHTDALNTLPLNQPVTLQSGAILERTRDAFILHNPGRSPVQVNVRDLGYLPPIRKPSQERIAAGRILNRMNDALLRPVLSGQYEQTWVEPPNRVMFKRNYDTRTGGLHVSGRLGVRPEEIIESDREYRKAGSPFNLAINARVAMQKSSERSGFIRACSSQNSTSSERIVYDDRLIGALGEIMDLRCMRVPAYSGGTYRVIYSRQYYVSDHGNVLSWESLLRDKETAQRLEDMDRYTDVAENIVQLLPLVGNAESGLKCINAPTLTSTVRDRVMSGAGALQEKRMFVEHIYSMNADGGGIKRAASCAATLPLVGHLASAGIKAAQLASFGKHVDTAGKGFAAAMKFFDDGIRSGKQWEAVAAQLPGKSAAASNYAKRAYLAFQQGLSVGEVTSALLLN